MTRHLIVSEASTRAELEAAIATLRVKQQRACIQSTRDEIGVVIDEVLELLLVKVKASA